MEGGIRQNETTQSKSKESRMRTEEVLSIIFVAILFVLIIGGGIIIMIFVNLDYGTSEFVTMAKTPCMDINGNFFEDQMCKKSISCSKYGLVEDYKCSDEMIRNLKEVRR